MQEDVRAVEGGEGLKGRREAGGGCGRGRWWGGGSKSGDGRRVEEEELKKDEERAADVDGEKRRGWWLPLPCACVEASGHACRVEKPVRGRSGEMTG